MMFEELYGWGRSGYARVLIIELVLVAATFIFGMSCTAATSPVGVEIGGIAFNPETVTVPVGATVTWTNRVYDTHDVTFVSPGLSGSGDLLLGDTFSYTFTQPGVFDYYCSLHRYMEATVIVE